MQDKNSITISNISYRQRFICIKLMLFQLEYRSSFLYEIILKTFGLKCY